MFDLRSRLILLFTLIVLSLSIVAGCGGGGGGGESASPESGGTTIKTLDINGTVNSSAAGPSLQAPGAIDFSGEKYSISVVDSGNEASSLGTASFTGSSAFTSRINIISSSANRIAMIIVKNADGKIIYKTLLGRVPEDSEMSAANVTVSGFKINDESTARTLLILEDPTKIPATEIATADTDLTAVSKRTLEVEIENRIGDIDTKVTALKTALQTVIKILTDSDVSAAIKQSIESITNSTKLVGNFVNLVKINDPAFQLKITNKTIILKTGQTPFGSASTSAEVALVGGQIKNDIKEPIAKPVFSPAPGTYTNDVNVTISCSTPVSLIKYTTNGSDPLFPGALEYTGTIPVSVSTVFRARAFKDGSPYSDMVTAVYKIKKLSSLVISKSTAAVDLGSSYKLSDIVITAYYSDSTYKTVTGGTWQVFSGDGTIDGSTFYSGSTTGETALKYTYTENGVTISKNVVVTTQTPKPVTGDNGGVVIGSSSLDGTWTGHFVYEYDEYDAKYVKHTTTGGFFVTLVLKTITTANNETVAHITSVSCTNPEFGCLAAITPNYGSVAVIPAERPALNSRAGEGFQIMFPNGSSLGTANDAGALSVPNFDGRTISSSLNPSFTDKRWVAITTAANGIFKPGATPLKIFRYKSWVFNKSNL